MKGIYRFIGAIAAACGVCGIGHAAPANDHWTERTMITELPFSASVPEVVSATTDDTDPAVFCWWQSSHPASPGQYGLWFGFVTGDADEYVDLDTAGYDTILAVYEGEPGAFVDVPGGCNDDGVRAGSGSLVRGLRLRANTAYSIFVAAYVFVWDDAVLEFSMSRSAVHRVTKTEDGDDGQCDEKDCSLREAVNQAIAQPGAILVPAGRYKVPGGLNFGTSNPGGMNLYGAGMADTVIDAAQDGRVMTFPAQDANTQILTWGLHDLTLANGSAAENGGAVFVRRGYVALERVAVTDSVTQRNGGGVAVSVGAASFVQSLVAGNRAVGMGGGAYAAGYNVEARESTFTANDAGESEAGGGGGLSVQSLFDFVLVNSTISANRSRSSAGGLYIYGMEHGVLNNVSIVGNTFGEIASDAKAGGLWLDGSNQLQVRNSVLAGNHRFDHPETPSDCELGAPNLMATQRNLVQAPGSCTFHTTSDLIGIAPRLSPLGLYDSVLPVHLPLAGSPLIDAGDAATCARHDARGVERPQDGNADGNAVCDIGAVEVERPSDVIFSDGFD